MNLRFRKAKDRADALGQVWTPPAIASYLVDSLPHRSKSVLDLGAGAGALTLAAAQRCPAASMQCLEIDATTANALADKLKGKRHTVRRMDILTRQFDDHMKDMADLSGIIANPAFSQLKRSPRFSPRLLEDIYHDNPAPKWVAADFAFLIQAWSALPLGGQLCIILTYPLIAGPEYQRLRHLLTHGLKNLIVTTLPPRCFSNVEVQTFTLTGTRSTTGSRHVTLRRIDANATITNELAIRRDDAIDRMDFAFHALSEELRPGAEKLVGTLADLSPEITRGSFSKKEFESRSLDAFHTTHFGTHGPRVKFGNLDHGALRTARKHDVLVPRVGSRCLLHQAMVVSGHGLYTDCVLRIRVPQHASERVWRTLRSEVGQSWRLQVAKGTCAQYITIPDLLAMPLLAA